MEIAGGVHRIDTDYFGRTNSLYLLCGTERTLLIDTGVVTTPRDDLLPYMAEHGITADVDVVLCTHADLDHTGGNRSIGEIFPSSVSICHEHDQPWIDDVDRLIDERYDEYAAFGMPEDPDAMDFLRTIAASRPTAITMRGGERVRLGPDWSVELVHVPGHSHGHLAVWDSRSGSAIVGDAVLGDGLYLTTGEPAFPPTYRDVDSYRASIERIAELGASRLLTSHYPTMDGQRVDAFLRESAAFVDRLDELVRAALAAAGRPLALVDVIDRVAGAAGPWVGDAVPPLKFPVLGHLEACEVARRHRPDEELAER
jgi:glyoxylase-like metal-dependent hydrolase (beta-lactamase superfamily II)